MNEDGRIEMSKEDYNELSDLIYGALENGMFGDGLIDIIHGGIMDELELNIDILVDGDEEDEEDD